MSDMVEAYMRSWIQNLFARDASAIFLGVVMLIAGSIFTSIGSKLAWRGTNTALNLSLRGLAWLGQKFFGSSQPSALLSAIFEAMEAKGCQLVDEGRMLRVGPYVLDVRRYPYSPHHVRPPVLLENYLHPTRLVRKSTLDLSAKDKRRLSKKVSAIMASLRETESRIQREQVAAGFLHGDRALPPAYEVIYRHGQTFVLPPKEQSAAHFVAGSSLAPCTCRPECAECCDTCTGANLGAVGVEMSCLPADVRKPRPQPDTALKS